METKGKFDKNDKLSFVSDDMMILGCDIGRETHYARVIFTILTKGTAYDPKKLLGDIVRPDQSIPQAA